MQQVREGDQVEFLEILQELEVIISGDVCEMMPQNMTTVSRTSSTSDQGGELAEPVDPSAHGQRIVDLIEVRVALAPDQLAGVHGGDDV